MVEGFHEYFKMKEEMDKVVQEQESMVEKHRQNSLTETKKDSRREIIG